MRAQLVMAVVMESLDGRVLDRSIHPLDLAVCRDNSPLDCCLILQTSRVVRLGQPVLDTVGLADHVEAHRSGVNGVAVPRLLGELDAAAIGLGPMAPRWRLGENCMDLIWHSFEHVLKELPSSASVSRFNKLGDSELGCAVDADEEVELALGGLHFGDVDVEEPDRVALELLTLRLVPFNVRQPGDPMTLQTPVQCRDSVPRRGVGLPTFGEVRA